MLFKEKKAYFAQTDLAMTPQMSSSVKPPRHQKGDLKQQEVWETVTRTNDHNWTVALHLELNDKFWTLMGTNILSEVFPWLECFSSKAK